MHESRINPSVGALRAMLQSRDALVHVEQLPPRPAAYGDPLSPLAPEILEGLGVDRLWRHQAEALDLIRTGRSVVISTGTASGKSLAYQAAIAETSGLIHDRTGRSSVAQSPPAPATALLVYPTKALGHDQLRAMATCEFPGVVAAAYDGDSTPEERRWVRRNATAVFTNPEMLHIGILPSHARWATFLRRLRYVVVDELHIMRGVFGSHLGHVLRRLRRLCAHYGSNPTFVFCSATIGDPATLASDLCGVPVTAVAADGSPRGARTVLLANPPLTDADRGQRASTSGLAADATAVLIEQGQRTITFCRSRRSTEVVAAQIRRSVPPELVDTIKPYRAGYLTHERRAIEAELFSGALRGVVATSALELGVDIGGLDACVLSGFPGTIASLWQQIGRAGRGAEPSVAVVIAGTDQLDQYLCSHPAEVFTRQPERAVVNLTNPYVADPQLACAAYELPLTSDDERWWGTHLDDSVRRLVLDDRLQLNASRARAAATRVAAVWAGRGAPAPGVGLRSGSGHEVRIAMQDGSLVGTVDMSRAAATVHPGAVYLHQGQAYSVLSLDFGDLAAIVRPDDGTTYTRAMSSSDLTVLSIERTARFGLSDVHLGTVAVKSQITGYQRFNTNDNELIDRVPLDLPPSTLVTRAFWYVIKPAAIASAGIAADDLPGTLHAIEHAAIGMMPLFAICDRWDVGGISTPRLDQTHAATIAIYDGYPGGAGLAEMGFAAVDQHLTATLQALLECPCLAGCPSCVQSPKCGNGNEPLDKAGAIALLRAVHAHGDG